MKKIQKRTAEILYTKGNLVYRKLGEEFIALPNAISFGKAALDSIGKGFYVKKI